MKLRILTLALVAMLVAAGCSKDDTPVTPSTDATVTAVSPVAGGAGTLITITGTNFGSTAADVAVQFGAVNATVETISATEIKVRVPVAAVIGATTIKVTKDGKTASANFTVNDPLVGAWQAEGLNVSYLLYAAPFKIRKIVATFNANGSYTVVQTDSAGTSLTLTGTWTGAAGGAAAPKDLIRTITINQTAPSAVTAEGIYEVTLAGSVVNMSYEIVQTQPPLSGVTKPTASGGFGSTSGGAYATALVQKYIKQ
jgi:hypothetical protein